MKPTKNWKHVLPVCFHSRNMQSPSTGKNICICLKKYNKNMLQFYLNISEQCDTYLPNTASYTTMRQMGRALNTREKHKLIKSFSPFSRFHISIAWLSFFHITPKLSAEYRPQPGTTDQPHLTGRSVLHTT